ncbi:MAG TPA: potassium channel family protein, partial [Candidatus Sulfotelmatobacter sp.]|nr:potassium channel family protein [Candidatus Sulfotelmatobacter sp.]
MPGWLSSPLRNLLGGIIYLLLVCMAATLAYVAAGWPFSDAFFMVVTTIFTVGYGEIRPVDTALLRGITVILIFAGCTGMIFVTGSLVQLITASQFAQLLGTRRMQKDISALRGHVIVCGYGRIGQMLARELRDGGVNCVILERSGDRVRLAHELGHLAVAADATDEEALRSVGVQHARALATVLPDDAANVFITLSARGLNPHLSIIARGEAPSTEKKLMQAGANRVVLPAHIGAERVAEMILFQDLMPLLAGDTEVDLARDLRRLGLELEILPAAAGSQCVGLSVGALE